MTPNHCLRLVTFKNKHQQCSPHFRFFLPPCFLLLPLVLLALLLLATAAAAGGGAASIGLAAAAAAAAFLFCRSGCLGMSSASLMHSVAPAFTPSNLAAGDLGAVQMKKQLGQSASRSLRVGIVGLMSVPSGFLSWTRTRPLLKKSRG